MFSTRSNNINDMEMIIVKCLQDPSISDRNNLKELYLKCNEEFLWTMARQLKVAPLVGHVLSECLGNNEVPVHWVTEHASNYDRISSYLLEVERIAQLLRNVDIPIILIENAAIAKYIYPCPGCFSFGDIDVIVRRNDLQMIHHILTNEGYACQNINGNVFAMSNGRSEYSTTVNKKHLLRLNLQYSLVARRWFNSLLEPDADYIFSHSEAITGSCIRKLCATHNLFQLAMHNFAHSYVRKPGIHLHLDIDRFVRNSIIPWDEFLQMVESYNVKTAVYFSLLIPSIILKTPIPRDILDKLKPSKLKLNLICRLLSKTDLFSIKHNHFSKAKLILLNVLVVDSSTALIHSIFPSNDWMRRHYEFNSSLLIPYYHVRRFIEITASTVKR